MLQISLCQTLLNLTSVNDTLLSQSEDLKKFTTKDFKVVSKKKPTKSQLKDLIFAFNVCRYVKSNAIVLANNDCNSRYRLRTTKQA